MGTKHEASSDPVSDPKKKRKVAFSKPDAGVDANDCIKIYLVSSKDEVGSADCLCIEPVDLSPFFEEDGKIYGHQGLKISIWISSISFRAYADISFESQRDGGKGITDLKSALQNIFADNLLEKKEDFLETFSSEEHYIKSTISNAEVVQHKALTEGETDSNGRKAESNVLEVLRVIGSPVGPLYIRLVSLVLLLIDGSNPIDVADPRWVIYVLVKREGELLNLIGFAAVYRFHRYPDSERLRLGQVLILPPYQRKGYGRFLLEVINQVATSEDVYDFTIEEPVDSLQHVRTCIDVQRLLVFEPIQDVLKAVISSLKQEDSSNISTKCEFDPPYNAIENVRKHLKINKRQFSQCWEILVYIGLDPVAKETQVFRSIVSERIKADIIGKLSETDGKQLIDVPTEYDEEMSFVMFKSQTGEKSSIEVDENLNNNEEQLKELVDMRMKEITSVAEKVGRHH
ncbi:hypothetical protein Leryth_024697 [Lithospermum erythrorhizon]|nr:hypothetical protein Leryth_024697 [Lithospermum erythrorhizon]